MSVKWEKQEGNEGTLTIEVSSERFEEGLDHAFKKVVKDVQIPGFRKGRIPRNIFENRFGVESLYQDAVDFVLPEAYSSAVEEAGIEPVDQPDIEVGEIERGQPLEFTAVVTVKPEVKLGEYKELEVEEQSTEVTEEELENAIEAQREQHAELIIKDEGEVEEGNTVVIDFEGFVDGEPFEGGKGENHSLEIGSGQFIPGFEEQLVGEKAGDVLEVELTFPEDYHAEELAGADAVFKVQIHEIKEKELPELDDDFAKDVNDEVETLEEWKQIEQDKLEEQKKTEAENQKRESLIDQATDNAEVDIPSVMIDSQVDQMVQEFEQQLQSQGMTMDMYFQFSGQDEAALKEQMQADAEKRVKSNLVLEAIFAQEELEVNEEDVNNELEEMSKMYGVEIEQLKQMLGGNTDAIKEDMKFKKAIDFLIEQSKVVEK